MISWKKDVSDNNRADSYILNKIIQVWEALPGTHIPERYVVVLGEREVPLSVSVHFFKSLDEGS